MAEGEAPQRATFSSPTMRARTALVRVLAATDDLERAWGREDYMAAMHYARVAREWLATAREAWAEAEDRTAELAEAVAADAGAGPGDAILAAIMEAQAQDETEAEARQAWGDR